MGVPEPKIRYAAAQIAAGLLENAAMVEHDEGLRKAVRRWFPDAGDVDEMELRRILTAVRAELMVTRAAVLARLDRWVADGKAEAI